MSWWPQALRRRPFARTTAVAAVLGVAAACSAAWWPEAPPPARPSFSGRVIHAVEPRTDADLGTPATPPSSAYATPVRVTAPASAPTTAPTATRELGVGALDCMLLPHQVVAVGAPVPGVVETIAIERGDSVRRGQTLLQLRSDIERASLAVARERARQSGELNAARSAQTLAQREAERAEKLLADQFVSRTYYDRTHAEASVAAGRGEQAEERQRLASREVELAQAQLAQRHVVAPIDGVVTERLVAPGEYVEQRPLLRIATLDPLRVDVLVPAASFGQVRVGDRARLVPELLDRSVRTANVTAVDRVVDAASRTFRVRLALPNPGQQLPSGLRCKVDLGLGAAASRPVAEALAPSAPASAAAPQATRPTGLAPRQGATAARPLVLPPPPPGSHRPTPAAPATPAAVS